MKLLILHFFQPPFISSLLDPYVLLSTLFSTPLIVNNRKLLKHVMNEFDAITPSYFSASFHFLFRGCRLLSSRGTAIV
jgi:hypothetical protein